MRARVCVLAVVVPRLMMVVKERSSFLDSLIGCAVLAMFKRYRKRASLPINLNYRVLNRSRVSISKSKPSSNGIEASGFLY